MNTMDKAKLAAMVLKSKVKTKAKHPRTKFIAGLVISATLFFSGGVILPPDVLDYLATETAEAIQGE